MAVIAQASIEQVKAVADMVEIVGARTQLRKSGARWMGRCPFHEDRTPSFSVDPADKLFYCHGCGKGGDLISFVRETEGLDFVGAIEWLADRYRIPLEYEETSPQVEAGRKRKERLLALLEQAATYYGRTLWESPAGGGLRAKNSCTSAGSSPYPSYARPQRSSRTTHRHGAKSHGMPVARTSVAVTSPVRLARSGSRVAPMPMLCGRIVAPTTLLWPWTASTP